MASMRNHSTRFLHGEDSIVIENNIGEKNNFMYMKQFHVHLQRSNEPLPQIFFALVARDFEPLILTI